MKIEFGDLPPIGVSVAINGQRYDLASIEDYVRVDGQPSNVLVWQADCAECGAPFLSKSGSRAFPSIRRCDEHRLPGRKVKS